MRKIFLILLIGFSVSLIAQTTDNKYVVFFTDKNSSPYSLTQPEEFLSERAIARRTRQDIPIDISDVPIDPAYIQGVSATGAELIIQVKWLNALLIKTESSTVLDDINNLSYVDNVEHLNKSSVKKRSNFIDKFEVLEAPSNLKASDTDPVYGDAFNQIDMVNGIPLHKDGFKGEGMVIAVLDAGFTNVDIRTIFKPLWDNDQILGSYNFVDPAADVFGFNAHGTLVLSIMGGALDGVFLGTAPNAKYWLLLTEESGSEFPIEEYNWVAGAAFADSVGADIINSSLGYTEFDNAIYDHVYSDLDGQTTVVTKAADLAASKGIIVVNSAGNSGDDAWKYILAPADGDSVMAVGAVYANETITSFSSNGFDWDTRVKPNIVAQGGSTVLANEYADEIKTGNGTSFSSPLIAGMMACLWQSNPTANNMDLIHAVEQSANQYTSPDNLYGYGIPDFDVAGTFLAINEPINRNVDFNISPNPIKSTGILSWNQSEVDFEWIELFDIQGKLLYKQQIEANTNTHKLLLQNYQSGIYFLRLGNDYQSQTAKILKVD